MNLTSLFCIQIVSLFFFYIPPTPTPAPFACYSRVGNHTVDYFWITLQFPRTMKSRLRARKYKKMYESLAQSLEFRVVEPGIEPY